MNKEKQSPIAFLLTLFGSVIMVGGFIGIFSIGWISIAISIGGMILFAFGHILDNTIENINLNRKILEEIESMRKLIKRS